MGYLIPAFSLISRLPGFQKLGYNRTTKTPWSETPNEYDLKESSGRNQAVSLADSATAMDEFILLE